MDTGTAAHRWADTLRTAWASGEHEAFVALYSDDATYRTPLGDLERAVDHMRAALALGEGTPSVWVGSPVVDGDWVILEWWAVVVLGGEPTSFAATAFARFADDGRV